MEEKDVKIQGVSASVFEQNENKRLAILMPGFLDPKSYPHLVHLAKDLIEACFDTVRFEPSGTWDSDGKIEDFTISGYLKDAGKIVKHMSAKKKYDKIVLIGHSLGGSIAVLGLKEYPEVTHAVGIMPPISYTKEDCPEIVDNWNKGDKPGYRRCEREFPVGSGKKRIYYVPDNFLRDASQFDLRKALRALGKPVLLLAGELDDTVLPDKVQSIYNAASEPKKFVLLEGIGHSYRTKIEQINRVNKVILDWLKIS